MDPRGPAVSRRLVNSKLGPDEDILHRTPQALVGQPLRASPDDHKSGRHQCPRAIRREIENPRWAPGYYAGKEDSHVGQALSLTGSLRQAESLTDFLAGVITATRQRIDANSLPGGAHGWTRRRMGRPRPPCAHCGDRAGSPPHPVIGSNRPRSARPRGLPRRRAAGRTSAAAGPGFDGISSVAAQKADRLSRRIDHVRRLRLPRGAASVRLVYTS